ncbi:reticulophagy receptor FAM134B-like isoform X2 [Willisornis vidua]|uniref:Reticulophagy receptor FAM134B-like isoform X2 n=1 Tax=Willisornis vidua TaxID=1566151 RepID=A0ABQ9CYU4_9PASS|nr:reticulophagy receptor FAM134B-like isoform X2 [Willisornis vidua]
MASAAVSAEPREPEGSEQRGAAAAEGDAEPSEVSGGTGAAAAVLGETGLTLGCCIAAALSWERPLRSLGGFVCANLLFCTVFRILHENNVDNTLMFSLLLSSAYPRPRTFQCSVLCQRTGAQGVRRAHGQDYWPKLAKGIFHTTVYPVYKLGGVDQELPIAGRVGLGIGQQVVCGTEFLEGVSSDFSYNTWSANSSDNEGFGVLKNKRCTAVEDHRWQVPKPE